MSRWKKLIGLGEKAVDEAQALGKGAGRVEPAIGTTTPLKPEDVADYLKTVKETGQTHRAGGAPAAQPNIEMAKKEAVNNTPNFGAGTGGLSGWQKYGLIGTIATASLAWVGNAITGDDPNDPADNNLTHIQRVKYKFSKAFSDEGNQQVAMAVDATKENSKKNLAEAEKEAVAASINRSIVGAQTAPPITFRVREKAAPEIESPKTVPERIDALENSFKVTEEEANKLRSAWKTVSQKPNSAQEFADNAKSIFDENKDKGIRQPSEAVELVRKLAL